MTPCLDHLVLAVPDLDAAVEELAADWGVHPAIGGVHPGYGTRNALLALSGETYLEIVGPDPAQLDALVNSPFGMVNLPAPRLAGWFLAAEDIGGFARCAAAAGLGHYAPFDAERTGLAGQRLCWRMALSGGLPADPVPPQLIDWGTTPHPARTAPSGCRLAAFGAHHPDAARLGAAMTRAGVKLPVEAAAHPSLAATIVTPRGVRIL